MPAGFWESGIASGWWTPSEGVRMRPGGVHESEEAQKLDGANELGVKVKVIRVP